MNYLYSALIVTFFMGITFMIHLWLSFCFKRKAGFALFCSPFVIFFWIYTAKLLEGK